MAPKTKPKTKKATTKAKKATTKAVAKKTETLLEPGAFATFTGYSTEVSDDEAVFSSGEAIYIVDVETTDDSGTLYAAIRAADVAEYQQDTDADIVGGQVAPNEVKPVKGTALTAMRDQYLPIPLVGRMGDLLAEHNGDEVETAIALNDEIQESYFYMGGALAQALQNRSYLVENGGDFEGDDAWSEFCQANFGFKGSKGRQLARIYITFSNIEGFDPSKLARIGWSIASKAEKYVTADNVDEVLDIVASNEVNQRNVDAVLMEKYAVNNTTPAGRQASRGGDRIHYSTLTFKLVEDASETVQAVIDACMKQNGIENASLALERICVEWAQDHISANTTKKRLASKAKKAAAAREKAANKAA